MDAKKIQQVYLRAMYSGTPDVPASAEEAFVVSHLSHDRLQVERAARVRNLRTVLHDDMRLLNRKLSKAELLPYVQDYAKSEGFWMHRGRTLIEDFSLFFVECTAASPVLKLLARIEGVYSGLSVSIEADTPWNAHLKWCEGSETLESFVAPFSLSFDKVFGEQSDYQPAQQDVNCVIRRSGQNIHVKFHGA
ncbi:hypothetical protein P3T18_001085 [Paraburkholderia sp. GAS199]|uniref:hypothetical protein n=1 Tax=Paraburkholderia sp. GAS199 TaxID=3035126 RepID=UPI003D1C1C96